MLVNIDNYDAVEMLMKRLTFWTDDEVTCELFYQYYERAVNDGVWDGREFNVMSIVDNDYVNWLDVITKDDFENYYIEDEEDERILETYYDDYTDKTYYLVSCQRV